jgi:hypothetical protein
MRDFRLYGTILALASKGQFRGSAKVAVGCNYFLALYVKATRARTLSEHLADLPRQISWRIQKEVRSDGVNTFDTADYLVIRSRAGMALQPKLGICAERRHRFSSADRAYSATATRILGRHDLTIN